MSTVGQFDHQFNPLSHASFFPTVLGLLGWTPPLQLSYLFPTVAGEHPPPGVFLSEKSRTESLDQGAPPPPPTFWFHPPSLVLTPPIPSV